VVDWLLRQKSLVIRAPVRAERMRNRVAWLTVDADDAIEMRGGRGLERYYEGKYFMDDIHGRKMVTATGSNIPKCCSSSRIKKFWGRIWSRSVNYSRYPPITIRRIQKYMKCKLNAVINLYFVFILFSDYCTRAFLMHCSILFWLCSLWKGYERENEERNSNDSNLVNPALGALE
jgi:hypothetical protein